MDITQAREAGNLALVLDDSLATGRFVCSLLGKLRIPAQPFKNLIPFLAQVRSCDPDLLVLDVTLERFDAIDVIRQLEAFNFKGKVLLMSGCEDRVLQEVARIGKSHGLAMLPPLRKPFGVDELHAHLFAPPLSGPAHRGMRPRGEKSIRELTLSQALEHGWLEVWYQPKVNLQSLTVSGAEALIRARHPEHGLLTPARFLPPAGDPGYHALTKFVLECVVADWSGFARHHPRLKLALNVPASVLNAPGFVELVRKALPRNPKFPGLIMELTEDEIVRDVALASEVATQLALYRVVLSIDDFGSGYASLSRLTDLPFAEIKLDGHFVSGCAADPLKRSLCTTVVDLARRFGASACAEGVEAEVDLRCLATLGFDTAQGFLLGKPMPSADLAAFLMRPNRYCDLSEENVAPGVSRAGS